MVTSLYEAVTALVGGVRHHVRGDLCYFRAAVITRCVPVEQLPVSHFDLVCLLSVPLCVPLILLLSSKQRNGRSSFGQSFQTHMGVGVGTPQVVGGDVYRRIR